MSAAAGHSGRKNDEKNSGRTKGIVMSASAAAPAVSKENISFSSAKLSGTWTDIDKDANPTSDVRKAFDETQRFLAEILRCEQLVVLSGLGTSLGVKGAPTMGRLWSECETLAGTDFDNLCKLCNYPLDDARKNKSENIEQLLSNCLGALEYGSLSAADRLKVQNFTNLAEAKIVELTSFATSGSDLAAHREFLRRLGRRPIKQHRTKLFTTNYDRCFEIAAALSGLVVLDGFSFSRPSIYDASFFSYDLVRRRDDGAAPEFLPNLFHLYKLHGSVDWGREPAGHIVKSDAPKKPLVIFPRDNKYQASYDPPFIDMIAAFQQALKQPKTALICIGFGFNDHHLTEPIRSALRTNQELRVAVVNPDLDGRYTSATSRRTNARILNDFEKLISTLGDPRVAMLNAKFDGFSKLIPDLNQKTPSEVLVEALTNWGRA